MKRFFITGPRPRFRVENNFVTKAYYPDVCGKGCILPHWQIDLDLNKKGKDLLFGLAITEQ